MKNTTKLILGVLSVSALALTVFLSSDSQLFSGRISIDNYSQNQEVVSKKLISCGDGWEKALSGKYSFNYDPSNGSDRVNVNGITEWELARVANLVERGCDMKIVFKSLKDDPSKSAGVICDQYLSMGNSKSGFYFGCTTSTPILSNNYFPRNNQFLYDDIHFWTYSGNSGEGVKLSKNRITHRTDTDDVPTSASFFITGSEAEGEWQVDVYLKK